MLDKADEMLNNLVEMTSSEIEKAKVRNYFTKDFIEASGVVISLVYGRYGKND